MTKEQIKAYIDKKQAVVDKNYRNYQETGERRYERTYQQAEDEIEIANMALAAADDHLKAISYKADLISLAAEADKLIHATIGTMGKAAYLKLAKNLIAAAKLAGYESRWL